jgi:hypothetical protein
MMKQVVVTKICRKSKREGLELLMFKAEFRRCGPVPVPRPTFNLVWSHGLQSSEDRTGSLALSLCSSGPIQRSQTG